MVRNWTILVIGVFLGGTVLPGSVFAGPVRVEALVGDPSDSLSHLFLEDDSGVFLNPALTGSFGSRIDLSLGAAVVGQGVGFSPMGGFTIARDKVSFGLHLNRSRTLLSDHRAMDTALQGFPSVPLYLPFDATLAFHLNDVNDVTIGFGFYGAFGGSLTQGEDFFATDPEDPDDRDESVVSESRTGGHFFAVSVGVSAQHGDFRPQGWFRFTSVSDWRDTLSYLFGEGTDGDPLHHFTDFTEGLAKTVGVSGGFRMPIEVSESVTIIPAVAAGFGTATTFQTDRLDTWDTDLVESDPPSVSTAVDFSGGVGVHYQATDKILAVFTVSANGTFSRLRDESFGDGDDDDYRLFVGGGDVFRLPVLSIGAEAKLLKHLTLRGCIRAGMVLGTTRSFSEFSDDNGFIEYSDGVANNATPQLSAAVGAAIPFEHVTVDLVLGGNLLSGESTDSFFSRVGVTFNLP